MNVFITGATGFIGRALTLRLRRDGHTVTAYVRDVDRARSLLGTEAQFCSAASDDNALTTTLEKSDAVVNLAGESLLNGRLTEARLKSVRASRLDTTRRIVGAMQRSERKPEVLVSASAVGIYGDGGSRVLTEDSQSAHDFLATLCRDWEAEAMHAQDFGVRVASLRIGVVLGRGGGALEPMLPAFRAGLGGPVGSGKQYVPWIHLEDLVELIVVAITNKEYSGPVNATAPTPVNFEEFARALGRALRRPSWLPVPGVALRALYGRGADVVLTGQRAIPERAQALGFEHRFKSIGEALSDLVDDRSISINPIKGSVPDVSYLRERKPKYKLETVTEFDRTIDEVVPFFSRPENLGLITPAGMRFRITRMPESLEEGSEIDYSLRVGPIPLKWTTRIDVWEEGRRFVDSQLRGPYASWWHEHSFESVGSRTIMTDRVYYAPPLGPLGKVANQLFVADELRGVFGYRSSVMRLRFGGVQKSVSHEQ